MHFNTIFLMSGGAVQALQLLAALSLLILLHEFGHFFFARLFKTRVEKFYLFFDFLFPFSKVLNFALWKKKKGDTEYGLGWFPLGGYVKISGMVDESMDKEQMALPPQPWEYRSKKPYQRLFIMLGGIIMNVLVAVFLYMLIFSIWGEEYLPVQNAKYGIMVDSTAASIGLKNGDKVLAVNGQPVKRFNKIVYEIIINEATTLDVEREGKPLLIKIPTGTINKIIKNTEKHSFINARIPFVVNDIEKKSVAESMKLAIGDSIIAFNDEPIKFYDEFQTLKNANIGKPITISVLRNHNQKVQLSCIVPSTRMLGIEPKHYDAFFKMERIKYYPLEAVGKGVSYTIDQFGDYWRQFKMIFTSKEIKASESLGGIYSFGKLFEPVFSWYSFLNLTAFISIILAFMNLLPIPGLDGGYVIFLLFEMITGRKVSEKVMERATTVGLVLLLGLMLYANGLDVLRWFKK